LFPTPHDKGVFAMEYVLSFTLLVMIIIIYIKK